MAGWSGSLWWSVVAAIVTVAGLAWAVPHLVRRRRQRRDRPVAGSVLGRPLAGPVALLLATVAVSLTWVWPGSGRTTLDHVPGMTYLTRPDGTALAVHVTKAASATEPPLVVVHGGPGVADMAHDVPAFAALATGRDVYVYDQIGAGASSRLANPTGYTTERAVQDLDAVRAFTGADRIALLGHSWGARIATAYLSRQPDRVVALVLSAPQALPDADGQTRPGDPTARLHAGQRTRLYLRLAWPRNLVGYALTAVDPQVAHALAGDAEMDRRFATVYADTAPALFCDPMLDGRLGTSGVGYYASQIPQLHPDDPGIVRSRLASIQAPVLVIKPACDYLPWHTAAAYLEAFPTARLVLLPDTGHQAYLERPDAYAELARSFLANRALPLPLEDEHTIPGGYRGVR
ncbi:alpha/beta hydrolase [Micromonospora sp. SL1-18]|uniref:alpha/beta hydrolase n=1 Tax=Micromonospora sp. SL1-18 TaxID=3399128 RepID=UPI003A4D539E